MRRHKGVTRPGDAGHQNLGRLCGDDANGGTLRRSPAPIGDQNIRRTPAQHLPHGGLGGLEPVLAQQTGLFQVHIDRGPRAGEKGQ